MGQEVVAVALEIVANEIRVVAVGDEADALGQKWILDIDLFQADRTGLAGNLGNGGDFVDQFVAGSCAASRTHTSCRAACRGKSHASGKADERGSECTAENDDEGMRIDEHAEVAAHQDHGDKDGDAGKQARDRSRYP